MKKIKFTVKLKKIKKITIEYTMKIVEKKEKERK